MTLAISSQKPADSAVNVGARTSTRPLRTRHAIVAPALRIGGTVDGTTGHVDHHRLGWAQAPVGPVLAETLGLPVSVAAHVDAMAGAELLLGMRRFATRPLPASTCTPVRRSVTH